MQAVLYHRIGIRCVFVHIGICCVVIGVVVVAMDVFANERLFEFFNVDFTHDLEEFVVRPGKYRLHGFYIPAIDSCCRNGLNHNTFA